MDLLTVVDVVLQCVPGQVQVDTWSNAEVDLALDRILGCQTAAEGIQESAEALVDLARGVVGCGVVIAGVIIMRLGYDIARDFGIRRATWFDKPAG